MNLQVEQIFVRLLLEPILTQRHRVNRKLPQSPIPKNVHKINICLSSSVIKMIYLKIIIVINRNKMVIVRSPSPVIVRSPVLSKLINKMPSD